MLRLKLVVLFDSGPCIIHAGAALFFLTFENIFNIMCIESERGTENPFQVSPCATGWPVRVVFSTTDEQQEKELRFRYSRVVRFRPRDAFFSLLCNYCLGRTKGDKHGLT